MKKWESNVIVGFFMFAIGLVLVLWGTSIHIPSAYNTFLGIPYQVNPEFASSFVQMIGLLLVGVFLIGMGLGSMVSSLTIYTLEKKLPENLPPPPTNPQQPSST
jgi:hypothetical protein